MNKHQALVYLVTTMISDIQTRVGMTYQIAIALMLVKQIETRICIHHNLNVCMGPIANVSVLQITKMLAT